MRQNPTIEPPSGETTHRARWHRHPVLVQAIPAVITGALALAGTLAASRGGVLPAALAPPPTTVTTTVITTASVTAIPTDTPTDTASSPSAAAGQVVWHRTIHAPDHDGFDLDQAGPKVVNYLSNLSDFMVTKNATDITFWASGRNGLPRSGTPSMSECRDVIDTNAQPDSYSIKPGATICLLTADDSAHLALLHYTKYYGKDGSADFDITVWQLES